MNKIGAIIIITVAVVIAYLMMLVVIPFLSDIVSTANTAASTATGNFEASNSFLLSVPWIMWFVPGAIGGVSVVLILRAP